MISTADNSEVVSCVFITEHKQFFKKSLFFFFKELLDGVSFVGSVSLYTGDCFML